ncbi:hypothetical protein [Azospirillum agricola]|uniref:hypothetical protein n=1 Tax=Azospirillum agricola TaxID=1720247 RepID=UPI000A0F0D3B|nr:hypothetical protein [Azospirillum agricola]MBP2232130.1 hypothetical protein [Azospirillum agricola]SMH44712.1 hypothetical protein SAMN02982994_2139 [Azospirillum lipoferum]
MAAQEEAAGLAALSICESLMIAMVEKGLLTVDEARGTLEDAAAAHHEGGLPAQIIERLVDQVSVVVQASVRGRDGGG